jgi:hypothetical protein
MKRTTRSRCRGLLAALTLATISRPAAASDPATATMLFNEARRLVTSGRYADACPKFEESQRLDPGIGTLFNLADCYEHTERLASAWALFLDVASSAGGTGQQARENVARKRAGVLEPRLSKLTIEAPKNVTGLEVRRNGEPLGGVLWNNPIPVDAGSYTIEASAPGKKTWSTVATVGPNGAMVTVTIPALEGREEPAATALATPGDAASGLDGSASSESTSGSREATAKTERIVAMGLGGAGVVGVAIGAVFGLRSISKHSDYEALCTRGLCAASAGPIHDQAVSAGNASTVAFLVGGALVAGGAVLWFVAPKSGAPMARLGLSPSVGAAGAGATFAGEW